MGFIALLSISTSLAVKVKNIQDPKDKRETAADYLSRGHSSHGFQAPSFGHGDANAISVGAGYSIGGKPNFGYAAQESGAPLQLSSEGLPSSGHATIQLAPITLQPSHGSYASGDLSELMSQLSQGLSSGAFSLSPYQAEGQSGHGGQELSFPQYSYGTPQLQQYSVQEQGGQSVPSYAAGTKGLGSYGSTGPVLFSPESHSAQQALSYGSPSGQQALSYGSPSAGHSFSDSNALNLGGSGQSFAGLTFGDSGHSLGGSGYSQGGSGHSQGGSGHSLGGSGQSLGGHGQYFVASGHPLAGSGHPLAGLSFGKSGYSSGGAGHSLGGSGHSLGGSGHSFGGSLKSLGGGYVVPSKSFKPSTFLGAHSDSPHGLSALSVSHGAPSFGSQSLSGLSGGHGGSFAGSLGGFGGGSAKFYAPSHLPPKSEGYGSHLESVASFSSGGHSSPSGYSVSSSDSHSASAHSPQYYVSSSKYPSSASFGEGSSSFKAPGHSTLSSFSSGPKHSFGGHSSTRYGSPKDLHGAHSETSYNTIKYSEELKPRVH